jgi:hypothetical protein
MPVSLSPCVGGVIRPLLESVICDDECNYTKLDSFSHENNVKRSSFLLIGHPNVTFIDHIAKNAKSRDEHRGADGQDYPLDNNRP